MIRLIDIILAFLGLIILSPILILIWIIVKFEHGSPLFEQHRLGYNQKLFTLIKFRTMKKNTRSAATHLIDNSFITPLGSFLRLTKIDEVPQLLNVIMGDMSLVGPRPCLPNQRKLINERKKRGVFKVKPGLTGLAQISRINMQTPTLLAKKDSEMIKRINIYYYFYYIFITLFIIFRRK